MSGNIFQQYFPQTLTLFAPHSICISLFLCLSSFLVRDGAHLGSLGGQTISDLGLLSLPGKRPLVCVAPHTPTLLALQQMAAAGVAGAAVVSEEGDLVASISFSDIR